MNKVALKQIGFVEQSHVDDNWQQQQQDVHNRDLDPIYIDGTIRFQNIDQGQASLTESLDSDANGFVYKQNVQFTVRTEDDRALAKKYERRPLVVHVWTVDGHHYVIGTKSLPAYLMPDKTNNQNTVETAMTVDYETLTPIM